MVNGSTLLQFIIAIQWRIIDERALEHRPHQGCFLTGKVTLIEWSLHKIITKMDTFDLIWYKHLPKFGQFIHQCYFPSKSVNHSKTPYVVPLDYKNDNNFLQHYRSLRLSHNTDFIDLFSACLQYFYDLEYYKVYAYNQPWPSPAYFLQWSREYQNSLWTIHSCQTQPLTWVHDYRYIDVEIESI